METLTTSIQSEEFREMNSEILSSPLYLLYVEGELGMHKGKAVFKQAFHDKTSAEDQMIKILSSGRCAFIVHKKTEGEIL